jgi:sec-independent protein translocase protein TatB
VVDLSPAKILVVLVVALVVLGPDRLPRVARQAGRLVGDLRKLREGLNAEVREAFGDPGALSNLPSLSNLPAQGRAWVNSVTGGSASSAPAPTAPPAPPVRPGGPPDTAPGGSPPAAAPPRLTSGEGPGVGPAPSTERRGGEVSPGEGPDGRPHGDGGFDPRFN